MAKSSKSQKSQFLEKRRAVIADLASKRRRQQLLRASGLNIEGKNKVVSAASLTGSPPIPPSQR